MTTLNPVIIEGRVKSGYTSSGAPFEKVAGHNSSGSSFRIAFSNFCKTRFRRFATFLFPMPKKQIGHFSWHLEELGIF